MLILTRKASEKIIIDNKGADGLIVVTVNHIKGGQVRLGIDASPNIDIHREEVYMKIKEEEKAKSASSVSSRDLDVHIDQSLCEEVSLDNVNVKSDVSFESKECEKEVL